MARRRRCDRPGVVHHVMNRGLARRTVFQDDSDRRYFLSRVAREVRRGALKIFAFCLMCNHYHMMVTSPMGCLSEAMMRIQNRHVRRFNRKYGRDGPLFRGRFHSLPIEDDAHWQLLFTYIHLNPVDAGMVALPTDYHFSSARYFAGVREPLWLTLPGDASARDEPGIPAGRERGIDEHLDPEDRWIAERLLGAEGGLVAHSRLPDLSQPGVQEWMEQRAVLADGTKRIPPCAGPAAILGAVELARGEDPEWTVAPNHRGKSGWRALSVGLLRTLAGLSYAEMTALMKLPAGSVRTGILDHQKCLAENETYRQRAEIVTRQALRWTGRNGQLGRES